ncbi:MAG: hypothetical protein HOO97_09865 [Sideroxydans sp.]|nr:hypothetical protein [Sideroxydans sp.]NOT99379.1 hypothetical protein [Sideroxydans sp.]
MMKKNILLVSMLAATSMMATEAMAEVGFQFRIPFQVTKSAAFSKSTGTATLLTFDVDAGTTVGILNENIAFTDTTGGGAVPATLSFNGLRVQKNLMDVVNVGMDFGNVTSSVTGSGNAADIFGGAKLLSSKGGKIGSYLNAELLYRVAKTTGAGGETNFGGVQLSLAAGVNF